MTGFRPPSVAGVSGGVGTTTLALALHGRDSGTGAGAEADIVVCRSSAESLDRAVRIADLVDPTAVPPVLAVTVDGADRRHPERLDELGPGWSAVVLLPHVGRWRGIVDPYREAAGLLGTPRERLPRALRPYLDAVARLARAVADSGRLGRPAASAISRPVPPPARPAAGGERPFTSYRAFVPVGADGPLTSIAVPSHPGPEHLRPADSAAVEVPGATPAVPAASTRVQPILSPSDAAPTVTGGSPDRGVGAGPHPDLRPVRGIRLLEVGGRSA
ncbi:hypothetical protein GCM10023215_35960 [Pseudonocardia yuanmonensis]|uniref:Uncharacterized protein n=1 Tax=Pseudonocardia yuanmonensis TaxID=1095914 RepID=A0ABP8WTK5_9PSEU